MRNYKGYPKVPTFVIEESMKEQGKKVLEEASELFAAVQEYDKNPTRETRKRVREEAADVNQALMNCLEMIGVNEVTMDEDVMDCFARNYARGRFEEPKEEEPTKGDISVGFARGTGLEVRRTIY